MANTKNNGSTYFVSPLPVTLFAHLVAIAVTTLVLVWLLQFQEGLAFGSDIKQKIFNLHPLLMVIGFVLITGEATMVFKIVPGTRKAQKLVHLILHLIALVSGVMGIFAIFKFHHELSLPHMYTFHSWIGMSTISLFAIQWLFSFFCFWWPGAEIWRRARLLRWHVFFSVVIFFMAILSAETGLVQRFIVLGLRRGSQEALIVNFTGLLIFLFAVLVGLTAYLSRS